MCFRSSAVTQDCDDSACLLPDVCAERIPVFEKLLHDPDVKVRMEAPEMFRVLGKRRPGLLLPYIDQLQKMAETDGNRVVRVHCQGAIKAVEKTASS